MKKLLIAVFMLFATLAHAEGETDNQLPNLKVTPGVVRTDITEEQICNTKWGKDVRVVTEKMKKQIFANYGYSGNDDAKCVPDEHGRRCELDHLISRELGGADDVANMWPQSYGIAWGASTKDQLENKLHKMVCETHTITLKEAQEAIRTDWISAYIEYVGGDKK